jgi:raffinose/stachyose/melibiose transport system substrate-binding protein
VKKYINKYYSQSIPDSGGLYKIILNICIITFISIFLFSSCGSSQKEQVILKYFENDSLKSDLIARTFEQINSEFSEKYPYITIETETCMDIEVTDKLNMLYEAGQFPDVIKFWSHKIFMDKYVNNNDFLELDLERYKENNYIIGALESNIYNDKLYGIPDSTDLLLIFYNDLLFKQYNLKIPETFTELIAVSQVFNKNDIIPVITNFSEGITMTFFIDAIVGRIDPDFSLINDIASGKVTFTDSSYYDAVYVLDDLIKNNVFPKNMLSMDYQSARDTFGYGKAAMYFMGSWEMGLVADEKFPEEVRDNIRAMKIPALSDKMELINHSVQWFGGNHVVNANTEHKEEALLFLDFLSEYRPQILWENRITLPAVYIESEPDDHPMVKDILNIIEDTTLVSGPGLMGLTTDNDLNASYMALCVDITAQTISPEEFCLAADKLFK